jgi:hypothetical protein
MSPKWPKIPLNEIRMRWVTVVPAHQNSRFLEVGVRQVAIDITGHSPKGFVADHLLFFE